MMYFYDENFMLPLSHDEVVHGKSPMLYKMPGDEWQKFANLRALYTYMWTHPGGRLLFMGNEFGQTTEWNYKTELDWSLLQYDAHKKLQQCVKDLNQLLQSEEALYTNQFNVYGFEWVDLNHRQECVVAYARKGKKKEDDLLIVLNLTPVPRWDWQIETSKNYEREIFNSDLKKYWGTGDITNPDIRQELIESSDPDSGEVVEKKYRLTVNLPPLGAIVLK
jgi:1,4-alpha-glucan branching enzyme